MAVRPSFGVRLLTIAFFVLSRFRSPRRFSAMWWVIPALKFAQWSLTRHKETVRTVKLNRGEEIYVSWRKDD